jgi:hypothetical protein
MWPMTDCASDIKRRLNSLIERGGFDVDMMRNASEIFELRATTEAKWIPALGGLINTAKVLNYK